ncbi:hypothetical protein K8R03_04175 [Candidatus Kaiserbacteria bacterium]|nr:hypothetical protein [Candidatus Kaiserbacteria bacterium]
MSHGKSPLQKINDEWLDLDAWVGWIGEWGVSRGMFLMTLFAGLYIFLGQLIPSLPLFTFNWLFGTAPIWVPISLFIGFWRVWVWYSQSLFLSGRNPVLLEMKVPRDIYKSPRAMEICFSLFSISSGETTFIHRGWKGQVRPFFSFEIASFGGELHFFIWCWKNYQNEVESAIYGQYPEVELHVVEDYATKFDFDPKIHSIYCTDWRLESYHGPSNDSFAINAYQPKSYIDFELDKDPKEEFKIDPLSTVLEFMSNIEPQEQIWAQIVIRKCGNLGVLFQQEQDHDWIHMVEHEVEKIRTRAAIMDKDVVSELGVGKDERQPQPRATWMQQEQMKTLQRHLGKYPFEIGARGCYITTGHMHGPTYTGTRWLWKPIGNPHYAAHFRPRRWHNPFDYPWQDLHDFRWNLTARRFLDAYRRRIFHHSPWITPTNIVTNETLATMWHPPSRTSSTPGLQRIPATKAPAPPNLPT